MTLPPIDLLLLRHGESEGNAAHSLARTGDLSGFTPAYRTTHGSMWRLTPRGVDQARNAGRWLRATFPQGFSPMLVSPFVRTRQTAAALELPSEDWQVVNGIRERCWGDLEPHTPAERTRIFAESLAVRVTAPFFWTPPNGESLATVADRVRVAVGPLLAPRVLPPPFDERPALIVCHGEVMTILRGLIDPEMAEVLLGSSWLGRRYHFVLNCDVVHYSRRSPVDGTLTPTFRWVRTVCASDATASEGPWSPIPAWRGRSGTELLEIDT
jgi:broad specificity phosphatase PhoE